MVRYIVIFTMILFAGDVLMAQSDSIVSDKLITVEKTYTKAKADSLYEAGLYLDAANAYESIIANQGTSADLYYNLGNAYYKLDDIAHAILNYERALLLDQGDADIRANLAFARGKTVDKVTPSSEMFFVSWWRNFANMVSIDFWAVAAICAFVLVLLGVIAYLFVENIFVRKIGAYGAMFCFVMALVFNLAALFQRNSIVNRTTAIVMAPVVTVKSSPNENSTELFLIHSGSKVEILDNSMESWMEVKLEEGKEGWIPVSSVDVI